MKMAESGKIVLASCIIDFEDVQLLIKTVHDESQCLQSYDGLLEFLGQILKKVIITLQALRFIMNSLNQSCTSSKSIMQLTRTSFPDSVIFIEKEGRKYFVAKKCNLVAKKN